MLQVRVQTLLYVFPPLPAHLGTWKETESTVCHLVVTRAVNQGRVSKTAVETNTPSSNRQALLDTQNTKAISIIIHYPLMLPIIHC